MLGKDSPPPTSLEMEDDEGDELESLVDKDQPEEMVVDERKGNGEKDEPEKDDSTKGEFTRWPSKEPMIEEATKQPLPAPYPQRLKKG